MIFFGQGRHAFLGPAAAEETQAPLPGDTEVQTPVTDGLPSPVQTISCLLPALPLRLEPQTLASLVFKSSARELALGRQEEETGGGKTSEEPW